jgi:hypothetical protein
VEEVPPDDGAELPALVEGPAADDEDPAVDVVPDDGLLELTALTGALGAGALGAGVLGAGALGAGALGAGALGAGALGAGALGAGALAGAPELLGLADPPELTAFTGALEWPALADPPEPTAFTGAPAEDDAGSALAGGADG